MSRSFFALAPGPWGPDRPAVFPPAWKATRLTINELWAAAIESPMAVSMVIRVRCDDANPFLVEDDKIESCVGLIDDVTRWRAAGALLQNAVSSLRLERMLQPCYQAWSLISSRHPASISMAERQNAAQAIQAVVQHDPADPPIVAYEACVAHLMVGMLFADSSVEAMMTLMDRSMFLLNLPGTDAAVRLGTLDVTMSSALLAESFRRLMERAPATVYMPLPPLFPSTKKEGDPVAAPSVLHDDDED